MKKVVLAALLCCLCMPTAWAYHPGDGNAVTMTRYVLQFSQMEKQLVEAQSKQDSASLDALLAPAFEVRKSSGEVIVRNDWIKQAKHAADADAVPSQMVVYEIGSYAVANFRLAKPGGQGGFFIVDIWVPDGSKWQLRARMQSPAM